MADPREEKVSTRTKSDGGKYNFRGYFLFDDERGPESPLSEWGVPRVRQPKGEPTPITDATKRAVKSLSNSSVLTPEEIEARRVEREEDMKALDRKIANRERKWKRQQFKLQQEKSGRGKKK